MAKARKFGAFSGVFTPSILTILGVIMYLRLPKIVGEAGLFTTLGIIALAHIISFATGLSVASIATDKKVEAGGTYYMISRSLGLPIGGTLGLALFVGLSFSVSLYLIGFSESFLSVTGFEVNKNTIRIAGSIMLLLVTIITFISTSLAIKTQFIIMGAIFLSLVSIILGRHDFTPEVPLMNMNPESRETFISLFGIFFPAVTGFEAGISMSGDLSNPKRDIPKGSISAILIGFVVYVGLTFFFAFTVNRDTLISDSNVLMNIAWFAPLVIAGIWGATVSSALGSILGAPRILQATAVDRISPRFFATGFGPSNEPRNALLLTFIIAEAGILVGELDVIARIVSIFFITTYGFLNLSCAFESWSSADFRPAFKIPIWISLLGAVACFMVMLELDLLAMVGATVILGLLYFYLKNKELKLAGGDAWSGVWASIVKTGLEKLNRTEVHTRNWRPNIIMFHGEMREHLVELGKAIAGRLGMLSGFQLIESNVPLLTKSQNDVSKHTIENNYFEHKHYCRDFFSGIDEISRVYGFSGIEPNTVLMGWSRNEAHKEKFIHLIKSLGKNNFNAIYLNYDRQVGFGNYKTIDVWWEGWGRNLAFAISLNKHMFYNSKWKQAVVRLLAIAENKASAEQMHRFLEKISESQRVRFQIVVINNESEKLSREKIITRESAQADLTILSLREKESQTMEQVEQQMNRLLPEIKTSLIIDASKDFEVYHLDLEPAEDIEQLESEVSLLPDLKPPKYSIAANALWPLDAKGLSFVENHYNKAFSPFFAENIRVVKDFISLIKVSMSTVNRAMEYKDPFRKRRTVFRAKSEFYFQVQRLLDSWTKSIINIQKDGLSDGMNAYQLQISEEVAKAPSNLTIYYNKNDYNFGNKESFKVKVFKLRKRAVQPLAQHSIAENVNFKRAASYFLLNNRHRFISNLYKDLNQEYLIFLNSFRRAFNKMEPFFDSLTKKANENLHIEDLKKLKDEIIEELEEIIEKQRVVSLQFHNRIKVDFRRSIQLFSNDLNKPEINLIINRKKRREKYYHHLRDENLSFPEQWHEVAKNIINRYYYDALINHVNERLFEEINELTDLLSEEIDKSVVKPILRIKENLLDSQKQSNLLLNASQLNVELNLTSIFNDRFKRFNQVISSLPENIKILKESAAYLLKNQKDYETVDIPVRQIATYFLESAFLGPVQDKLENVSQELHHVLMASIDSQRLARFNYENPELQEELLATSISDLAQQVAQDQQKSEMIKEGLISEIKQIYKKTFEPFSSVSNTAETAKEFSHFLKGYQSKKTISRVQTYRENLKENVKNQLARVIYSKSEGVLLAKRLGETEKTSTVSKIMDFVEAVSPKPKVMEQLPNYYKNLFSGRSSIGQDFWIIREKQEFQLQKAVNRFFNGVGGGIALLGERNSGKTAFCRYAARKYFPIDSIYQIYPPRYGSVNLSDLEAEFKKSGIISGSIEDISEYTHKSAIILHDLELWWERSAEGGEIIAFLKDLIERLQQRRLLFIINMNPFAFALMDKIYKLSETISESIYIEPFDAEELKNLIMLRHFSSRMQFRWKGNIDRNISEWRLARLFNNFFNYSSGNPGDALNAWISSISDISGHTLQIESPKVPDLSALDDLNPNWMVIMAQMILHKRLSKEKLLRIFDVDNEHVISDLHTLSRSGIVVERNPDLYILNPYTEPFITSIFKEKGLI